MSAQKEPASGQTTIWRPAHTAPKDFSVIEVRYLDPSETQWPPVQMNHYNETFTLGSADITDKRNKKMADFCGKTR